MGHKGIYTPAFPIFVLTCVTSCMDSLEHRAVLANVATQWRTRNFSQGSVSPIFNQRPSLFADYCKNLQSLYSMQS